MSCSILDQAYCLVHRLHEDDQTNRNGHSLAWLTQWRARLSPSRTRTNQVTAYCEADKLLIQERGTSAYSPAPATLYLGILS